jgi:hypothetical protein
MISDLYEQQPHSLPTHRMLDDLNCRTARSLPCIKCNSRYITHSSLLRCAYKSPSSIKYYPFLLPASPIVIWLKTSRPMLFAPESGIVWCDVLLIPWYPFSCHLRTHTLSTAPPTALFLSVTLVSRIRHLSFDFPQKGRKVLKLRKQDTPLAPSTSQAPSQ